MFGLIGLFVVGGIFGFVIATLVFRKKKGDSVSVGGGNSPSKPNKPEMHKPE